MPLTPRSLAGLVAAAVLTFVWASTLAFEAGTASAAPKTTYKPTPKPTSRPTPKAPAITPSYEQLIKIYGLPPGSLGFLAVEAETGRVIAARAPDGLFIPASAIKAPTAVAALNVLGPDYRFETSVHTTGSIKDGVLYGDVILRGGGDPKLATEDLDPMLLALKAKGIREVSGRFLYDASYLPTQQAIELGEDEVFSYNPSIGPLSLNFNRVRLRWALNAKKPVTEVVSKTDRVEVPLEFLSFGVAPNGMRTTYGLAYDDASDPPRWLLSPRARRRGEMWVPVKRPAEHAADVFRQRAKHHGITLPQPVAAKLPPDAVFVARHRSEPMTTIVREFLKYSNNMMTELTGMVAARRLSGEPLGLTPSAMKLAAWFKEKIPEVDWSGVLWENMSGLSTRTRMTPRQMVAILRYARNQSYGGYRLVDLMKPYWIAARSGARNMSVAGVFEPKKRGRSVTVPGHVFVRAKTGTLSFSRALAGYLRTVKNKPVVFAVFVSDYRAREVADRTDTKHTGMPRGRWAWRSRSLMRAVLLKWVLEN